jgi:hypothetical protein
VTDELSRRSVQHEDQLRLAWIVAALRARVTAEERPAISKAMRRGVKHTDFLAHSLWPPSPEYIAVAFEALRTPEATTYQGADSVSGQRKTRSLHEFVVGMLREATNRDFGASAQAWERWWEDEGRFLEWDQDQMIYRKR